MLWITFLNQIKKDFGRAGNLHITSIGNAEPRRKTFINTGLQIALPNFLCVHHARRVIDGHNTMGTQTYHLDSRNNFQFSRIANGRGSGKSFRIADFCHTRLQ